MFFLAMALAGTLHVTVSAAISTDGLFTSPQGAMLDSGSSDSAYGIAVDRVSAGGPFIYVTGIVGTDPLTIKYDRTGKEITHVIDTTGGSAIALDSNGNVYVAGGASASKHVLSKYNSALQPQSSVVSAVSTNWNVTITAGASNTILLSGAKHNGSDWDIYLARYDSNLVLQSSTTFDSSGQDFASGVWSDASGAIYVAGYCSGDACVIKFDSNLVFQTSATVISAVNGTLNDKVKTDSAGNVFVVAGNTPAGSDQLIVSKFDANLNALGSSTFDVGSDHFQYPRDLAIKSNGDVYVAGNLWVSGFDDDFLLLKYNNSLVLQSSVTFSYGAESPSGADLDASGNLYVTGGRNDYRTIIACLPDEPCYSSFTREIVDSGVDSDEYSASVVDQQGNLHVVYTANGSTEIRYKKRTGSTWSAPQTIDANGGGALSLAIDSSGHPHVAYQHYPDVRYAVLSSSWIVSTAIEADGSNWPSLALNAADLPRLSYFSDDGSLRYAEFDGVAWSSTTVEGNGPVSGGSSSLALDAAGQPRIAYSRDDGAGDFDLKFAERNNGTWTISNVDPAGVAGQFSTLALDGAGEPRIAYSKDGFIAYASRANNTWTLQTLDDTAQFSNGTAMVLDGSGYPHIAYYLPFQGWLMETSFDGTHWRFTSVDTTGNAGTWSSLAIDSAGELHLAYRDVQNNKLMVAHRTGVGSLARPLSGSAHGKLQAPTAFAGTAGDRRIDWSWTDNASNETGFQIYGATSITGPFSLVADETGLPSNTATYRETGLVAGTTYYRYVVALNAGGFVTSGVATASPFHVQAASHTDVVPTSGGTVTFTPPPGQVIVSIPAGAFADPVTMTLSVPAEFAAVSSPGSGLAGIGVGIQIDLDRAVQPSVGVPLTVSYRPSDVSGIDESHLVLARYEPSTDTWIPLVSTVDHENHRVSAVTNHFSLFQIMQLTPAQDLAQAKAYPNPLRPSLGHTGITFTRLPADARVRIYGLRSELVRDFYADSTGQAFWNATNDAGEAVASGVYFVFIEGNGHRHTLKVAVER